MAIDQTYRELLLEKYVKEQLTVSDVTSASDIKDTVEDLIDTLNLAVPQFTASGHHVEEEENSSVAKHIETFTSIRQDLQVLYNEMADLTKVSSNAFERWKLESESLEKRLIDLEDRIENLLLLTQDTGGHHSVIIDNFTDTSLTDLALSTTEINSQTATVEISSSIAGSVRYFLNDLEIPNEVIFKVRTTIDFSSRNDAINSGITKPFAQESDIWWTSIRMKKAKPVSCELTVKISKEDPVPLSKIIMDLHQSGESGPVYVTPLYSTDNQTFNQLPTNTFTQEVRTNAVFTFAEVEAKWVKFILTKKGPDSSGGGDFFPYEFGFKNISFYHEGFEPDVTQVFVSEPLWVAQADGTPQEFEKLTLETCERIETDTSIKCFITTTNTLDAIDSSFDYSTASWIPISPVNRANPKHLTILDVGDITQEILGDTEEVKISYDGSETNGKLINPADSFYVVSRHPTTNVVQSTLTHASGYLSEATTKVRYAFKNTNDRILNYQFKETDYLPANGSLLNYNERTLTVLRNVGEQGLDPTDVTNKVRSVQRGWRYSDPYYTCVIEIENPEGISLDVGDNTIFVDEVAYTNVIDKTVLTGKVGTDTGFHTIRVHKSNWKEIAPGLGDPSANGLDDIKEVDLLYPYNHKLLIEGYDYHTDFDESKIYLGVDLFAETVMKKISIFDLIDNVKVDNYDVFAFDYDAPTTHVGGNDPTRIFILKADENNPDSKNERFMIRFTLVNQLQKYLRLRADFTTEDAGVTPALHSYKIKLA